jgi:hypothetical protein
VPFQQRDLYIRKYKGFATVTIRTRRTRNNQQLPTVYVGGKWNDGTELTASENDEVKRQFVALERPSR